MLRIPVTILFCCILLFSYAQDTTKKAQPVKIVTKYKTYKQVSKYHTRIRDTSKKANQYSKTHPHHLYRYHRHKTDTAKIKYGRRDTAAVKPVAIVPAGPVDKSLNGQYQFLLTKIYHYQQPWVSAVWKNAMDTLSANKRQLKDAQSKLTAQGKLLDSLKNTIANKDQTLTAPHDRADEVNILGISLSKTAYNLITWGLILLFGITAVVVIARSANYRHEAKEKAQLYNELEDEFKAYKTKANDKEKKLARELQTERNKVDELMGRG
jgi:hypothetical protein